MTFFNDRYRVMYIETSSFGLEMLADRVYFSASRIQTVIKHYYSAMFANRFNHVCR